MLPPEAGPGVCECCAGAVGVEDVVVFVWFLWLGKSNDGDAGRWSGRHCEVGGAKKGWGQESTCRKCLGDDTAREELHIDS